MFRNLFFLLLFLTATVAAAQESSIVLSSKEVSLEDVIFQLESKYGLLFTYRQQDVEKLRVTPPKRAKKLTAFLSFVLKGSGLEYEVVEEKYILLSRQAIDEQTELSEVPLETFRLCGTVKDNLTGEPLFAANAYLQKTRKGVATSVDGSFAFQVIMDKNSLEDTLVISYVGYREQKLAVKHLLKRPCTTILLDYYDFYENFLIVKEYLTDGISHVDNGASTQLQPDQMGALPGQVEPDVLNVIQFLPGVSSVDGSPSGICVQGGTPDQNLILWEGIPIYHTAHYFGMLSAFNPYFIDKVSVYTGGFGAEYGGRISGVIQLESEAEEKAFSKIAVGSNLIHNFLDGQLVTDDRRLSMVYSVRKSMAGLWHSPAFNNITKRVQQGVLVQNIDLNRIPPGIHINDDFSFFDANLKVQYQLSDKNEISVAGFFARNDFEDRIRDDLKMQIQSDTFNSRNSGLRASLLHRWRRNFSTNISLLHTDYNYDYGFTVLTKGQSMPDKIGQKQNSIKESQIHLMSEFESRVKNIFKLGYQLINYDVKFDISRNGMNDNSGKSDFLSNVHVLYADFESNKEKKYGVNFGLRLSHFEQVQDQYLEPRVRIWYHPNDRLNLYLSAGRYYQFLSQLIQIEGDQSSIETPVWALTGSKEVPVLNAYHFQAGMIFRKNTWLLDLQAYAKTVDGLTSLASGFDEGLSNRYHLGDAKISGLNILLKKRWGKYKSWLSYSLRNVDHHFDTFFDTNFPGATDQPHNFKWAHMWDFGQFECSLGWSITSGRPFSSRENFRLMPAPPNSMGPNEVILPVINEFNGNRLPAEHQLDASFMYRFDFQQHNSFRGIVGFSLYNIYHKRNIYRKELFIDNRPGQQPILSYVDKVNMGFTPNFIFRLEW